MFKLNQEINHKIFGKGHIIKVEERGNEFLGSVEPTLYIVEFENEMLTETEKKCPLTVKGGPIKIRRFTEDSIKDYLV